MKLTLKMKLTLDEETFNALREISEYSGKFYNMVNYDFRNGNFMSFYDMYDYYKDHMRCKYLQAHTYENALKQFSKDYKSYQGLLKNYKKNSNKYNRPSMPRYKHANNPMDAIFAKTAIRIRKGKLLLSIGKEMKKEKQIKSLQIVLPEKVLALLEDKNIKMIKFQYSIKTNEFTTLVIYEIEEKSLKKTGDLMSIDLGVKNLAAITFMHQKHQYLIDGNVLKCQMATYNKWLKEAVSKEMKNTGSKYFKATKKVRKKYKDKKNYIKNYIHQASRKIVEMAIDSDVKTIVIGDFKHIKNENKIKYFVEIPHSKLKEQIAYKAKLEGIEVVFINEAYTSIVSSIDLEKVNQSNANKKRRITRGLFKTSKGIINSDINGSLNILRKYDDYKNIPMLIKLVRDKGYQEYPIRLKVV